MNKTAFECQGCRRKTWQNLSNRCQYCGAELPEHMKMDDTARQTYLHELEDIEKESEEFARGMSKETLFQQETKRKKREKKQSKKGKLKKFLTSVLPEK